MLFWMLIGPQKLHDRTSTTAYVVYLGGNAILRLFKKQKSISRSSIEVEYRVVASIVANLLGSRHFFTNFLSREPFQPSIVTIWVPHIYVRIRCFILE